MILLKLAYSLHLSSFLLTARLICNHSNTVLAALPILCLSFLIDVLVLRLSTNIYSLNVSYVDLGFEEGYIPFSDLSL